ncbi:MAG: hypothetical protein L0H37_10030 [Nitrosospira sp.]|nr:hypothetical protein [Nitrosospira sp.]
MIDLRIQGHGKYEKIGNYARVRRIGDHVYIAGTTAIDTSGEVYAPGDTYKQTLFIFKERIAASLAKVDASLEHVVLTRGFLTDISTAGDFVRAHGEVFADILPVSTGVQVVLTRPTLMVEIEVEAIVRDLA